VYVGGGYPAELTDVPVVLAVGLPEDGAPVFTDIPISGAAVLHVIGPDKLSGRYLNPMLQEANREGAVAHIVVSDVPAELWEEVRSASFRVRWQVVGVPERESGYRLGSYAVQLHTADALLRAIGEDPTAPLPSGSTTVRLLDGARLSLTPHHTTVQEPPIANVVGVLEGSDPELRHEAVVFTGHIDHVGTIPGRCRPSEVLPADSICNGADDNASGTVGVIELAEAFASLDERPARTLVFAAVTAEERGLCGSRYYVEHPVVPIERTVAELNLDMIARNPPDTVGFVGKDYTSLGAVVDRVLVEYPELGLVAAEHRGRYGASDHFPFVQRGVPALFFFSGEHEDLHTAADNPERADAGQAARIVRLAFLVGLDVANATERPSWDEEAWRSLP
jgi:Zn-dependent M28 family amino/carboxypeptidase